MSDRTDYICKLSPILPRVGPGGAQPRVLLPGEPGYDGLGTYDNA